MAAHHGVWNALRGEIQPGHVVTRSTSRVGVNELPGSEHGQVTNGRGGEVPRVAGYQRAPDRERAFCEGGVVGIWKAANEMSRGDDGVVSQRSNPAQYDQHFMSREVQLRSGQHLLVF